MKRLLFIWTLGVASLPAATHLVLPDTSIQEKIDVAVAGDVIAISGGDYNENLTIDKAVRLVELEGAEVFLLGDVTFDGVADAPAFEGFEVGSTGRTLTARNTTGLVIKDVVMPAGNGLLVDGASKVGVVGGSFGAVTQSGGELTVSRTTINGNFNTSAGSQKTVAFRVTLSGSATWLSDKAWFGYSKARGFSNVGHGFRTVVVGSEINRQSGSGDALKVGGDGNVSYIINNIVYNMRYTHPSSFSRGIVVGSLEHKAFILNNYVSFSLSGSQTSDPFFGDAIRVDGSDVVIANNHLTNVNYGISAPFGTKIRYNGFRGNVVHSRVRGGAVSRNEIDLPTLPDYWLDFPVPNPAAPVVDAGDPNSLYDDLDGTRNDLGPRGGPLFDPDGWTTDKPVVISFDLGPQSLQEGVDSEVNLSNGQAVAQP